MEENNAEQSSETRYEQDSSADARVQETRRSDYQQAEKCNCLDCLKQVFHRIGGWLIYPFIWFYRLDPISKFTAILCVIGLIQAWIFLESERASFGISGIALIPNGPITVGQEPKFTITVKNGGKDTVEIVDGRSNHGDPKETLPLTPHYYGDAQPWHLIILPGEATHLTTTMGYIDGKPVAFTADDIRAINAGTLNIWLYGYITYRDRFSSVLGSETIGFCYRYIPESDPATGMFGSCGIGADAYTYVH